MDTIDLLLDLRQAGIEPEVVDDEHLAFPAGVLTDAQRQVIRQRKAELIAMLTAGDPVDLLARRYYLHHWSCRHCIAGGWGYGKRCEVGLPLWQAYVAASNRSIHG